MVSDFYGRAVELGALEDFFKSIGFKSAFVVVYGRRRIGKTELARRFVHGKKCVWLFVETKSDRLLLDDLENEAEKLDGVRPKFDSWDVFFRYVFTRDYPLVLVFDEFQNFAKISPGMFSKLQKFWDEHHRTAKVMLLATGSFVGMIKKLFYDKKEPLFGRADAMINLKPFSFFESAGFLRHFGVRMGMEEELKTYALFGGVAKYLLYFPQFGIKNSDEAVKRLFFEPPRILLDEGKNLLVLEFGSEHKGYFSVLDAISAGKVQPGEIADYTKLEANTVAKYLHELYYEYELLLKETPITEEKQKSVRYFLRDNFFSFWFRFVYGRMGFIERSPEEEHQRMKADLNSFFGRAFEGVAREFLLGEKKLPLELEKIGRWWGNYRDASGLKQTEEIDLVGLNEKKGEVLFVECKWKELDFAKAHSVLEDLKRKSLLFKWRSTDRKEYFGLVAKKVLGKEKLKREGFFVFDLADFERR